MSSRAGWWLLVLLGAVVPGRLAAATVRSWSVGSAAEFAQGTFDGTALDPSGEVILAPRLESLWGPDQGVVWDLVADGTAGAFVALTSPTRVLRLAPGREPEIWHHTGDETLVAAMLEDGRGGLYLGISPNGQVLHAMSPTVRRVVAETGTHFIWALEAAADGGLWIGTGLPGRLVRLGHDGTLETRFEAGDDPVRALVAQSDGGVVLGTGGRGRVVRVDRSGRAFALFDADEAEVVGLATDGQGAVYALTARGSKQLAAARTAAEAAPQATVRVQAGAPGEGPGEPDTPGVEEEEEEGVAPPETRRVAPRFRAPRGGALYRIAVDGGVRKLWEAADEVPFGLLRRRDGTLLVATGDQGRVLAIDEWGRAAILAQIGSDQASALAEAPDGSVLVGGTTDAGVARLGPGLPERGIYLSAVHDAGTVADWGRLAWDVARSAGSELHAAVRSGNTAEPDATWSEWVALDEQGVAKANAGPPPSRWFQVRVEIAPGRGAAESLRLRRLELFHRPRNRRPAIDELTVQPPGVVWTQPAAPGSRQLDPVVLDDVVSRRTVAGLRPPGAPPALRRSYEVGARTVSWRASDPDDDALSFRVDLKREGTRAWIPLAAEQGEPFLAWDARGFSDGLYRVRLTADDRRDNPTGQGLTEVRESAPFWIDNTHPVVGEPKIGRTGADYEVEFVASDPGGNLAAAEVAVDAGEWRPLDPQDGVTDSREERYEFVIREESGVTEEPRTFKIRVTDSSGNIGGNAWVLDGDD